MSRPVIQGALRRERGLLGKSGAVVQLSAEIAKRKIEEVLATGAQAVVTSCQQCVRTMTTYVRRNKIRIEVMDITQLVHRALRK